MSTQVLLADDHEILRTALALQLEQIGGYTVRHAWSLSTLLAAARHPPACDVAVVDVHMPGMEAGRQLQALYSQNPGLPIIILTGATELPFAAAWSRWPSVHAILHKTQPSAQLLSAIEQALQGVKGESTYLQASGLAAAAGSQATGWPQLSTRQIQVARAAAGGASNKHIAMELGLTEGTVKQYLKEIFHTLGVSNRTQLALLLHDGHSL